MTAEEAHLRGLHEEMLHDACALCDRDEKINDLKESRDFWKAKWNCQTERTLMEANRLLLQERNDALQIVERFRQKHKKMCARQQSRKAKCIAAGKMIRDIRTDLRHCKRWLDKGMEVANSFLDKPSESHIVDRICIIGWERDRLRAEVKRADGVRSRKREAEIC